MAAGITINGSGIGGAFVGSSEVGKIYLGSVEVYSKPSTAGFTVEVSTDSGMPGQGYLTGVYGSTTVFDYQGPEYISGDQYQVQIVAGQNLVIRYYVDHGYCNVSVNGTRVHEGYQTGSYSMTPQVGDSIVIDWYFED